jgi:hypothetical protein
MNHQRRRAPQADRPQDLQKVPRGRHLMVRLPGPMAAANRQRWW